MVTQVAKRVVDVGELGNASTGDILYDGGVKINENFDSVYNAFADQRLFAIDEGANLQLIHATGYYQKTNDPAAFIPPVSIGSMHDIDTTTGTIYVNLPKGKLGEGVIFVNFNGSISIDNALVIRPNDRFVGVSGELKITSPFVKVECWCVSDSGGVSVWNYSIGSLFGTSYTSVDATYRLTAATPRDIVIAHKDEFRTIKLLLTATSADGRKVKSSEVNLLIDPVNNLVYNTEYASIRLGSTDEEDEIYTADYTVNAQGYITLTARTDVVGIVLAVKTINTQRIGVAI
ncbi:hypothetical protein fHeYen901_180 [Yersinia phage fHe-Yen9-01]|uniref:Baseplate wedge tail fiber connector n=1 Tax=Yersinia phage fHe-Yen9-01 TaxID=1965363 RepID=A0A1V0DXS1_9CAUD|nr:baseplate wedge tail fiber protein connector [Yersinia phage fHe-Yen9-01]ARB05953.1 hypothetical protein fHeYen901_180 [Yersinia phage fHe-Yen9-01]